MATGRIRGHALAAFFALASMPSLALLACGGGSSPPAPNPPCDQSCQDETALRSLRDSIKLAFNLGLQGQPVGAQDASAPCPLGGSAHVSGEATSNADVGSTQVALTYAFEGCAFSQSDTDPKQTYQMTLTGTITESGTIAVQPTASTALIFDSGSMSFSGTVYSPSVPYDAGGCAIQLGQNGNDLAGTMCGRAVGITL